MDDYWKRFFKRSFKLKEIEALLLEQDYPEKIKKADINKALKIPQRAIPWKPDTGNKTQISLKQDIFGINRKL